MASSSSPRQHGTIVSAFRDGWSRVLAAPLLWIGTWLLTLVVSVPTAAVLGATIDAHLGQSRIAEHVAHGDAFSWWREFLDETAAIGTTLVPSIVGGAAPLRNISTLADGLPLPAPLIPMLGMWALLWVFVSGGITDRLMRQRRVGGTAFFGVCGRYAHRLIRLTLCGWVAYGIVFGVLHRWLFSRLTASRAEASSETQALVWWFAGYVLVFGIVSAINLVLDYARIRLVVEDRRSAVFSVGAGARFVIAHAGTAVGLYAVHAVCLLSVVGLYLLVAPGLPNGSGRIWLALVMGQGYVFARLGCKLAWLASEISLFEHALAPQVIASTSAGSAPEPALWDLVRAQATTEASGARPSQRTDQPDGRSQ